jgi:hypothetical protein
MRLFKYAAIGSEYKVSSERDVNKEIYGNGVHSTISTSKLEPRYAGLVN